MDLDLEIKRYRFVEFSQKLHEIGLGFLLLLLGFLFVSFVIIYMSKSQGHKNKTKQKTLNITDIAVIARCLAMCQVLRV
jgi:hypothetical protein